MSREAAPLPHRLPDRTSLIFALYPICRRQTHRAFRPQGRIPQGNATRRNPVSAPRNAAYGKRNSSKEENMNRSNRTRTLTTLGILTAIILVMAFTPLGYIKTLGLEITLLHIPVILGAALTGPVGGMVLGAVFGLTSFFQCFGLSFFGTTLFSINPVGTFIVCVVPRVLLGLVAAYLYRAFDRLTGKWSGTITGALSTLCHTAMFMGTLVLFFYTSDYIQGIAQYYGATNIFAFIIAFVGLQGLLEIVLAAVIVGALVPVIKKARRA